MPAVPEKEVDEKPVSGKKEVLVWVDLRSNVFSAYGRLNDPSKIRTTLDTLKQIGVTALVVDVKTSAGFTVYPSKFTRQLTSMDGISLPSGFDYLGFMIGEAHQRGLKIYASTMVFVEGDYVRKIGNVFEDKTFKDVYQSIVCDVNGNRVPITQTGRNGFVNPALPAVQERAISIMKEIVQHYDVDGIITDYCRYADIYADFSDFSKEHFFQYLESRGDDNARKMKFPQDIVLSWQNSSGAIKPAVTGPYYKRWLNYRAGVLHDFIRTARAELKAIKPDLKFGSYTGAWYTTYYEVGVNWASNTYDPSSDSAIKFSWADSDYKYTGLAEQLDLLMTGNYFTQLKIDDNPASKGMTYHWWSIEGSINGARYVTKGKVPVYGSIDMGNLNWSDKRDITQAIQLILSKTDGVMLFDLVHIYVPKYNRLNAILWGAVSEGLQPYK